MKILICGSSGFIGTHMVRLFADSGHQVIGLDLLQPISEDGLSHFYPGDILVKEDVRKALAGVDCVVNLAAKHHDFGISRDEYFQTNEIGSQRLLECLSEFGIKKYVFYSSVAVYGESLIESDETTEPRPTNPYGESKLAAEKVTHNWAQTAPNREVVIIRPSVVFGEGNTANMFSLIKMVDKHRYVQFGSGEAVKCICYVRNIIEATQYCMKGLLPGVVTFNYVDKDDMSVKQTVDIISDELDKKILPISFPLWLGVAVGKVFDLAAKITGKNLRISSARVKKLSTPTQFAAQKIKDHGFVAKHSIEEGLRNMVIWYVNEIKNHAR